MVSLKGDSLVSPPRLLTACVVSPHGVPGLDCVTQSTREALGWIVSS